MKEMIINEGMRYWLRDADGNQTQISPKKAWALFKGWKDAGLTIRRLYGMGGRVTWVWAE